MRAPWSAVRNSSNPTCWNARRRRLLHSGPNVFVITPDRLPARDAFAPALGRATPAHRGTGARSPSHLTDPANRWGLPQTLAHVRAPSACAAAATVVLCLAPARTRRSAPSSTKRPRPAPCAPGWHPRSGPLQPSPSRLPSSHPLPRPTRRSSPSTSPSPPAELHTTGCSAVPPNRGRGMKILIKNLSPSRTYCQEEGKHLCPHSQHYLVLVPVYTNTTPNPKRNLKNASLNNFVGRL